MTRYAKTSGVDTGFTAGDNEEGAPDVRYEWLPSAAVP